MIAYLLAFFGGLMLLGAFMVREPAQRSRKRRMDALKSRYGASSAVETQMRKIAAARTTSDGAFQHLIPNPDLLRRRIEMAGKDWSLASYVRGCAAITVVVWGLMLLRHMPVLLTLFLGVLIGVGLPHFVLGKMAQRRTRNFITRFPDAIELLVRGLRSGLPISETISVVGSEVPEPVGSEFRSVADRMRIGRTMEASLQETADKLQTAEFQFFVITLAIQRETGGNLAETLGNLAEVLRKRMQMKLKIKAMSSESKASAYIIGALPFLVFGIIWYINPDYMGGFFVDPRLKLAAIGGAIWMSIGAFIMAKMIAFEI